jgi:hypothetical protein
VKVTNIANAVYALAVVAVIGFGLAIEYLGEKDGELVVVPAED